MVRAYDEQLRFLRELQNRQYLSAFDQECLADVIERIVMLQGCEESAESFPKREMEAKSA